MCEFDAVVAATPELVEIFWWSKATAVGLEIVGERPELIVLVTMSLETFRLLFPDIDC